jgi:hypothetical protein
MELRSLSPVFAALLSSAWEPRMSLLVRHKSPLPRGWAYPVGVELLTEFLGSIPHNAPEPLWFRHAESLQLKERRRRLQEDLPLPVLEACFTKFAVGLQTPTRPVWRLDIMSVPNNLRAWVRRGLVEQGLPRVRAWLLEAFPATALESEPRCAVLLQEGRKQLLWQSRRSGYDRDTLEELANAPE